MKYKLEDIGIGVFMIILYGCIALAAIFGLIQCGSDTYRDLRDLNKVDTLIVRDTVEVHDTVVNGYRDINALRDTLHMVKGRLNMIDIKAKYIDPYNDSPQKIASDITDLRNYILDAKKFAGVE